MVDVTIEKIFFEVNLWEERFDNGIELSILFRYGDLKRHWKLKFQIGVLAVGTGGSKNCPKNSIGIYRISKRWSLHRGDHVRHTQQMNFSDHVSKVLI